MSDDSNEQYRVGYRKPPLHTRFQKGRSGNPSGKAKEIKNLSAIIREALGARTKIETKGRPKRVTKLEAAVRQLVDKAVAGDPKILQMLIAEFQRFEPFDEQASEKLEGADKLVMDAIYARIRRDVRADLIAEMQVKSTPPNTKDCNATASEQKEGENAQPASTAPES